MEFLHAIPSFLVAIIILVAVHEFGHFYVARRCGVKVLRFSLGFGKVLLRRYDKTGTEYTLSALPFGGYVKMLDEREGDVPAEVAHQAFNRKTVLQRMAIVVAGPVANFILAILLFWILLLPGEKGLIPVVGIVAPNSIAAKAGLEVGQEIIAVDGELTPTEQAFQKQLLNRLGESGSMLFKVSYPKSDLQYDVQVPLDKWMQGVKDPDPLDGLGLQLAFPLKAIVGEMTPSGVAEQAGFKAGDQILQVDQLTIKDWRDWFNYVRANPKHSLAVTVQRGDNTLSLRVTPEYFTEPESFQKKAVSYGRVGMAVQAQIPPDELFRHYDYSLGGALAAGVERTWETAGFVLLSVKKLILGEISTKNLSGPISIAKVAGSSAQNGLKSFVGFVALLSVFLGVFNLLPIPVLDGGHLLYLFIEVIKGKPVSEKMQILSYQVGIMLVIGLSIVAMYNDIMRL